MVRLVKYKVRRADGTKFETASFREAQEGGNVIEETFFAPYDERPESVQKAEKEQSAKVVEYYRKKRAERGI